MKAKRLLFKIFLFVLPIYILLICVRPSHQLDNFQTFLQRLGALPNLADLLKEDLQETKDTFMNLQYSFNFTAWQFPTFDASSFNAFFGSIGAFFSSFGQNLANTFTSLFSGLGAFFNACGQVLKTIGNFIVNVLNYLLAILQILFT